MVNIVFSSAVFFFFFSLLFFSETFPCVSGVVRFKYTQYIYYTHTHTITFTRMCLNKYHCDVYAKSQSLSFSLTLLNLFFYSLNEYCRWLWRSFTELLIVLLELLRKTCVSYKFNVRAISICTWATYILFVYTLNTWVAQLLVVAKNENTGFHVFHNWNNYRVSVFLGYVDAIMYRYTRLYAYVVIPLLLRWRLSRGYFIFF